jgi:hypothetical protein
VRRDGDWSVAMHEGDGGNTPLTSCMEIDCSMQTPWIQPIFSEESAASENEIALLG